MKFKRRGRFNRRRRHYKKRRFIKRDPFKRALRQTTRTTRRLKHSSKFKIQRALNTDIIYRKFSRLSYDGLTTTNWTTVGGTQFRDYGLGHCMSDQDINFYKARYLYGQLVGFNVTFYIENTKNLVKLNNLGVQTSFFTQQQVTDTSQYPEMYVAHWNSAGEQTEYNISANSLNQLRRLLTNKHVGRLSSKGTVTRSYHLPSGYRGVMNSMATWTGPTPLDEALAGPINNEPHGYTWYFPSFADYNSSPDISTTLGVRVDSIFAFRGRRLDT